MAAASGAGGPTSIENPFFQVDFGDLPPPPKRDTTPGIEIDTKVVVGGRIFRKHHACGVVDMFGNWTTPYGVLHDEPREKVINLSSYCAQIIFSFLGDLYNTAKLSRKGRKTADRIAREYLEKYREKEELAPYIDLAELDKSEIGGMKALKMFFETIRRVTGKQPVIRGKMPSRDLVAEYVKGAEAAVLCRMAQRLSFAVGLPYPALKVSFPEQAEQIEHWMREHEGRFQSLTSLDLSRLGLTCLPSKIFHRFGDLEILNLGNNLLRELPRELFDPLKKLQTLSLGSNDLTTLPRGIFDSVGELRELRLEKNNLAVLPWAIFDHLEKLKELWLEKNKLTQLALGVFDRLENLETLSLKENSLTSLFPGVFDSSKKLRDLYIDRNELESLLPRIFEYTAELQMLSLSGNRLIDLPGEIFSRQKKLVELCLEENQLTYLPVELFYCLPELRLLSLQKNKLKYLDANALLPLANLRFLNLSENDLTDLPLEIFDSMRSLTHLHLEKNEFRYLDNRIFQMFAQRIDIWVDRKVLHTNGASLPPNIVLH